MSAQAEIVSSRPSFGEFVNRARAAGRLVVQPRMGFSDPERMRAGLLAVRDAPAVTVGTVTLDSYTRVGDHAAARKALNDGVALNGYPLVAHSEQTTAEMLLGIAGPDFPIQVRHGSSQPEDIFTALVRAGLSATEGGPVSYCLPYSRTPLREAVASWRRCCEVFARWQQAGARPHLETFGGCMLGQLCPPSLLVAISLLEGLFFAQQGLLSISLSYAQQTHAGQDEEAVRALDRLAGEMLPPAVDRHIVIYTYMGVYPRTRPGARRLLEESARLAMRTGAARLIVKTEAEAYRIPTISENLRALQAASEAARKAGPEIAAPGPDTGVYAEARALIDAVRDLDPDIGRALPRAFELGLLDIPYCLHPENANRARSVIDSDGRLRWSVLGGLPLAGLTRLHRLSGATSSALLTALSYVETRYDHGGLATSARAAVTADTRSAS